MNRQPYIVGPGVDKLLGFLTGFFANVLGFIATVVVMYIWAGNGPDMETWDRRSHAQSVSIWSGLGCLAPFILIALAIIGLLSATPRFG